MSKVYQIITDRVIELLEAGTAPWRREWGGKWSAPRNLISGKDYRGINVFLLGCHGYSSPYWLTFNQAKKLGGTVRKGEKGMPIVFWKQWEREDKATGEKATLPVLRYFSGFHVSQCDGIPESKIPTMDEPENEFSPIEQCERVLIRMEGKPSIRNDYHRAFYRPADDLLGMPKPTAFESPEGYYATLFHELTHATGHEKRLNRKGIADVAAFGDETYGKEELIAEMGAAFLCGHTGIETVTLDNSAAYLAGWLRMIKKDCKLVVQAAAAAQKAVDHVLGRKWEG